MGAFASAFQALAPMFAVIMTGYLCKRLGVVDEREQPRMNHIGFQVFLPALLFCNIYRADLHCAVRTELVVFILVALPVTALLATLLAFALVRERSQLGTAIQAVFRGNFVLVGMPIVCALYDAADLVSIALAVAVPMMNLLSVTVLELYGGERIKPLQIAGDVMKNPLVIASLLGAVFLAAEIRLPAFVESAAASLAQVASPYLLFWLGAFFRFRLRFSRELVFCIVGKLLLVPAAALGVAFLMGFRSEEFAVLLALFAAPNATSCFTMAQSKGGDEVLAGNAVVLSSAFSAVSLFGWIVLFQSLHVL